jgi:hypothetical protein
VHQQVYLHPYPKKLMLWNHVWGGACDFLRSIQEEIIPSVHANYQTDRKMGYTTNSAS